MTSYYWFETSSFHESLDFRRRSKSSITRIEQGGPSGVDAEMKRKYVKYQEAHEKQLELDLTR